MDEELPKNFLKEVIIRFDFAIPIENIEHKLPKELSLDIRKAFPICEIAQIAEGKIDIRVDTDSPDVGTTKDRYTQWRYFGDEKRKLIELDKKHFAVIFYHYQTFTEFQQTYRAILDIIYKNFGEPQFERVGLRYINEIQLEEKDPLNWTKYLDKSLLSIFKVYPDKSRLSRAFHVLCITLDNIKITFQYGMHNPDFPAPIKQKIFILDYDAYHEGIIEAIEIDKYVDSFRSEIKTLFKGNIKSALKNKMR